MLIKSVSPLQREADSLPLLVHVILWPFAVSVSQYLLLGPFPPDPPRLLSLSGLQPRRCVFCLVVVLSLGTRLPFTLLIHLSVCPPNSHCFSLRFPPLTQEHTHAKFPPEVLLCCKLKIPTLSPLPTSLPTHSPASKQLLHHLHPRRSFCPPGFVH